MTLQNLKKILPDTIAIVTFVLISFIYFFTPTLNEQVLLKHDTAAGIGAGQEAKEYYEEHGERTRWTNSLFSGMPTYQIAPSYNSTDILKEVSKGYGLFLPKYMGLIFIMLLGFYILMRSFKVPPLTSAIGSIMWAFSSYFFILIGAGHLWKFITLAYVPPTIAGINWAYQKKYLLGASTAALFASLQIMSNHVQMTYYFLFVILFIVVAYLIYYIKNNELSSFFKATGVLMVSAIIAISINSSTLYHTYQYSKLSNRGESELLSHKKSNIEDNQKAYITQWSYGIDETLTFLIPNFKGGVSTPIAQDSELMNKSSSPYPQVYNYFTQYFGSQPFTAGPVYIGAFVIFLAILGCFIVRHPIKWALIGVTLLSIILSWGKNFMPITDFFIDYIPLYSKFRAVSSILVIAQFTIPILAILSLVELINKILVKEAIDKKVYKYFTISFVITAGLALIIYLFPSISGTFISNNDINILKQLPSDLAPLVKDELIAIRSYLVQKDALRSLIIICAGVGVLFLYFKYKINKSIIFISIGILCLVDLWQVDKRYLNDNIFTERPTIPFKQTEADKVILQDKNLSYRVLNLTTDTFNENNTSYWHKSVGGYNAAKIKRYQELIEYGIAKDINRLTTDLKNQHINTDYLTILNMLNTKYIILNTSKEGVLLNNSNYGNCWFVKSVKYADNATDELNNLLNSDPKDTAIVNSKTTTNSDKIKSYTADGNIELVDYSPNKLTYKSKASVNNFAVFSEIFYPGWSATIDGKPTHIMQVNYVLRGVKVPKGEHEIIFEFKPKSIKYTDTISYVALLILGLIIIAQFYLYIRNKK